MPMLALLLTAIAATNPSIQDLVAAQPGQVIQVPPGTHVIEAPILLNQDGAGLVGPGVIVQSNPALPIVRVDHARDVLVERLTLTRPEGARDATESALRVDDSTDVIIRGVRVIDNHSASGSIAVRGSQRVTVSDCDVRNYKTIAIDDRTTSPLYGYAFHCIDGAGISVDRSLHTAIVNNRVVEDRLLPTRALKEAHSLGTLTEGREPLNPGELARGVAERGYVDNWHQGSAIVVTGPEHTRHTRIQGNTIVNAAQAIDMHCDYANVTGKVIENCMIGIKGTHGCYGLVVAKNTITGADLWGMVFNPGAASHGAEPATDESAAKAWNGDAGLLIASNLIAGYGYGNEYWNWGGREADAPSSYGIALFKGQLDTNQPFRDILITGNQILAGSHDLEPGTAPRYRYAIYGEGWDEGERRHPTAAEGVILSGNTLQQGLLGVSNIPISE